MGFHSLPVLFLSNIYRWHRAFPRSTRITRDELQVMPWLRMGTTVSEFPAELSILNTTKSPEIDSTGLLLTFYSLVPPFTPAKLQIPVLRVWFLQVKPNS